MKIAFTGASGTGKTSVLNGFLKTSKTNNLNYKSIVVNSRKLLTTLGLGGVANIDPSEFRVFQLMHLAQKIDKEFEERENFITDRSFADCLAYWRMHCSKIATKQENNIVENLCKNAIKCYSYHFFFPTGFIRLEDDGFRHTSAKYHYDFEKGLMTVLSEVGIEPVPMPLSNVEERVKFILGYINA